MGVAGHSTPHLQFNGKIRIERVRKIRYIHKIMAHTNFSHDSLINSEMKHGNWRSLVNDDDTSFF